MRKSKDELAHELSVRHRVRDFVREMQSQDHDLCRESRQEYLRTQIGATEKQDKEDRIHYASAVHKAKTRGDMEYLVCCAKRHEAENQTMIRKHKSELNARWDKTANGVTQDQIALARTVPLWRLLGIKPGSRIPCKFHNGKDRNFNVYHEGGGYCFVCNKAADSIGWLVQVEKMSFVEAVRVLCST